MPESGRAGMVRASDTSGPGRRQDAYQRYAASLYQQALLTLADPVLAERVVRDVIDDECERPPVPGRGEDDARYRLAESVFRCCHQLGANPAQRDHRPAQRPYGEAAGCPDPVGLLDEHERGALGLVLFGGLGYVRASRVVGIDPRDMAVLLRAALLRLRASPAANDEDSQA